MAQARDDKDNIRFGEWWDEQKFTLDGRLLDEQDRAALAKMGRKPDIMREVMTNTDRRSIQHIYKENKNRFDHVIKTPRRKGGGNARNVLAPHYKQAEIIAALDRGLTNAQIAEAVGVGKRQVRHIVENVLRERHAAQLVRAELHIDPKALSPTAQQKLEIAIRQERKRLETENKLYLDQQIDFHIKRLKAEHLPKWEEDAKRARISREYYEKAVNNHKPIFTEEQYMSVWRCLHPDSRKSLSEERMNYAFTIFEAREFSLIGKKRK